jgi:hypothetical protein
MAGALNDVDEPGVGAEVYCSVNDGDTWTTAASTENPTARGGPAGGGNEWVSNFVVLADDYADTGIAWCASDSTTTGEEGAVSMTTDYGMTWNGISMIDTDMGTGAAEGIADITFVNDAYGNTFDTPMFMLTTPSAVVTTTTSVWSNDGTFWERLWLEDDFLVGGNAIDLIQASRLFSEDNCVFVADSAAPVILRSTDGGNTFAALTRNPAAAITAWAVVDDETIITGDAAGVVYKTERYGRRAWTMPTVPVAIVTAIASIAVEPNFEYSQTLLIGDSGSQVFISTDAGDTFEEVSASDLITLGFGAGPCYVTFDPLYTGNRHIYAAVNADIARCVIDVDLDMADQAFTDLGAPAGLLPPVG